MFFGISFGEVRPAVCLDAGLVLRRVGDSPKFRPTRSVDVTGRAAL
jgi:hypothetical protein